MKPGTKDEVAGKIHEVKFQVGTGGGVGGVGVVGVVGLVLMVLAVLYLGAILTQVGAAPAMEDSSTRR